MQEIHSARINYKQKIWYTLKISKLKRFLKRISENEIEHHHRHHHHLLVEKCNIETCSEQSGEKEMQGSVRALTAAAPR